MLSSRREFRSTALRGPPLKPWLYRIATNLAQDSFRKGARERSTLAGEETAETIDTAPGPEELLLPSPSASWNWPAHRRPGR